MNESNSLITAIDADELRTQFGERVAFDISLAPYTSWHIGGPADALVTVNDSEELAWLLRFSLRRRMSWFVLGYGSNILIGDGGIRGIVIRLAGTFTGITFDEDDHGDEVWVTAGGGASLALFVGQGASRGAAGIEALAGIPGSIGGAVRMNAGTSREIGEFAREVRVQSLSQPLPHTVPVTYVYRKSTIAPEAIITQVRLAFPQDDPTRIRASLQERLIRRKATQPVALPSGGSCFRNPENERAGQLIEAIGAKGWRIGGALVSPIHANFIVNDGGASAEDVAKLMTRIRRTVEAERGIILVPEVHFVGVFTSTESQQAAVGVHG